jgi:BlaI family transcriptional regulator, penicillinase repressor
MEAVWCNSGPLSIREIQEVFPARDRLAYPTIRTTVYRLEDKNALRQVKKISNAHIFEDDFLRLFGGRAQPVMAHPGESGRLTLADVQETQKLIRDMAKKRAATTSRGQHD